MPKTIAHIKNVEVRVKNAQGVEEIKKEGDVPQLACSCRFCLTGQGIHKVNNNDKNEAYYLCDNHKTKNPVDGEDFKNA